MKITRIYKQKKGKFLNIDLDEEYAFSLKSHNTLVDANIYVGKIINETDINEIIKIDLSNHLTSAALNKAITLNKSKAEIIKVVKNKALRYLESNKSKYDFDINPDLIIDRIIENLDNIGYLDDAKVAKKIVQDKIKTKYKSKAQVKYELMKKGLDKTVIEQELECISKEDEEMNAKEIAMKKFATLKDSDITQKLLKITRYLFSKGYSYDIISRILKDLDKKSDSL